MAQPTIFLYQFALQFRDRISDLPLAGGNLYFYDAGTSTPKAVYADYTATTTLSNPIVLDETGYAPSQGIWLGQGAYKIVVTNSTGVVQQTVDNIQGIAETPAVIGLPSIVVDTVLSMANVDHTQYSVVTALGYNEIGDGGGGLFYWFPNSTSVVDNGIYFKDSAGSATGRWTRIFNESELPCAWWGALPNISAGVDANLIAAYQYCSINNYTLLLQGRPLLVQGIVSLGGTGGSIRVIDGFEIDKTVSSSYVSTGLILSPNTLVINDSTRLIADPNMTLSISPKDGIDFVCPEWWGGSTGLTDNSASIIGAVASNYPVAFSAGQWNINITGGEGINIVCPSVIMTNGAQISVQGRVNLIISKLEGPQTRQQLFLGDPTKIVLSSIRAIWCDNAQGQGFGDAWIMVTNSFDSGNIYPASHRGTIYWGDAYTWADLSQVPSPTSLTNMIDNYGDGQFTIQSQTPTPFMGYWYNVVSAFDVLSVSVPNSKYDMYEANITFDSIVNTIGANMPVAATLDLIGSTVQWGDINISQPSLNLTVLNGTISNTTNANDLTITVESLASSNLTWSVAGANGSNLVVASSYTTNNSTYTCGLVVNGNLVSNLNQYDIQAYVTGDNVQENGSVFTGRLGYRLIRSTMNAITIIKNVTFNNSASIEFIGCSNAMIENCFFYATTAYTYGSAIWFINSVSAEVVKNLVIENNSFINQSATTPWNANYNEGTWTWSGGDSGTWSSTFKFALGGHSAICKNNRYIGAWNIRESEDKGLFTTNLGLEPGNTALLNTRKYPLFWSGSYEFWAANANNNYPPSGMYPALYMRAQYANIYVPGTGDDATRVLGEEIPNPDTHAPTYSYQYAGTSWVVVCPDATAANNPSTSMPYTNSFIFAPWWVSTYTGISWVQVGGPTPVAGLRNWLYYVSFENTGNPSPYWCEFKWSDILS